jgi:FkbM family methyltransferase
MSGPAAVQQWLVDHLPARAVYALAERRYAGQEPELRHVGELATRGRTAIDVGGWLGPWTRALSRVASTVHTFEPQARLARRLAQVVPANVVVHHAAVGARAGTARLAVEAGPGREALAHLVGSGAAVGSGPVEVQEVPLVALDDLDLADVSFVKIDVEGHELAVLQGAESLLRRDRPTLLVEVEQRHLDGPITTVFDWLGDRGWTGSFLRGGRWVGLAEFDLERDQTRLVDRLPDRAYVNNFRFDPA